MTTRESAVKEKDKQLNLESITSNDLTWIYIERPTEQETAYLAQHFPNFHPLNLDDILSRIQRPKIDEYKDHLFIVLHFPFFNQEECVITSSELDVFIGENYLITVDCSGNLKALSKFFKFCEINDEAKLENFSQGSGHLLYRIIDQLVDYCFPILNRISADIEETEDNIFASKGWPHAIGYLSTLRRDVISFRRIIWPMRAVIASLEPKIRCFTKTDLTDYFGDTIDHVDKLWDALDEYKEVIEGLNATHDSLLTNRTSEVMRVLTIMGTIMLPLIVISGLWSMNIPLPFGADPGGSPYFFGVMVGVLLSVIGTMLLYFRHKRWI
jgi:magnesium transporter